MTYSEKYDLITKAIRDKGEEILPSGSNLISVCKLNAYKKNS